MNQIIQSSASTVPAELSPGADAQAFRDAMSCLVSAVHVVTTDGPFGRGGFTATSVVSVSDAPPTLLVCVNSKTASIGPLRGNGVFCVNTLLNADRSVADTFAGRTAARGESRFSTGAWDALVTGSPTLVSSAVVFDCRLTEVKKVGSHDVCFGRVLAIRRGLPRPILLYQDREYKNA